MSSLSVGIVGLPNSGKSTLFNALLKRQVANVASYPFTTIEPNVGVVKVPDERLKKLAELINPEKVTPAVVKFIDIAGLIKDSHKGEGLGNQFLAKIREVDAIIHILRAFKDESVSHYYGSIEPQRDKEIVDLELELGEIKKPTLYVINAGDKGDKGNIKDIGVTVNAETGEGVDELIKEAYKLLGLITFYTIKGNKEVTAWALKKGRTTLEAAEKVHTDMAKGFIKAEVIGFEDLTSAGSWGVKSAKRTTPLARGPDENRDFTGWQKAKSQGKVRLEGRDYQVKDGDVVEFKFGR